MKPRLKASKAWTDLPDDFKTQVTEIFHQHFKDQSQDGKFTVDGRIFKNEIFFKCGYLKKNSIRPLQFDLSIDYNSVKDKKPMEKFELLVDLGANLLNSYFENPDQDFPYEWYEVDFSEEKVFIKIDHTNDDLESEANKLLGETNSEELIKGDLESEELETIIETLNKKPEN